MSPIIQLTKCTARTTEYRYNVDGLLIELVCRNGEDEQVTKWEYGVGLYEVESVSCGVARNDLVRAIIAIGIWDHLRSWIGSGGWRMRAGARPRAGTTVSAWSMGLTA